MFGLGFAEIAVILVVALLVLGPKHLPEAARTLGRTVGMLRRTLDELRDEISITTSISERQTPQRPLNKQQQNNRPQQTESQKALDQIEKNDSDAK